MTCSGRLHHSGACGVGFLRLGRLPLEALLPDSQANMHIGDTPILGVFLCQGERAGIRLRCSDGRACGFAAASIYFD